MELHNWLILVNLALLRKFTLFSGYCFTPGEIDFQQEIQWPYINIKEVICTFFLTFVTLSIYVIFFLSI